MLDMLAVRLTRFRVMEFIRWWHDLPQHKKYIFSWVLIALSTMMYFVAGLIWSWGWFAGGFFALLTFFGVGDSDGE